MKPTLSVLCVTRCEPHAWPFLCEMSTVATRLCAEFVIAADRVSTPAFQRLSALIRQGAGVVIPVASEDYIESVLDEAVSACSGDYVLRLDDDERCSPAMVKWLASGVWRKQIAWAFPTAALWGDEQTLVLNTELWPQEHTRLTRKALAGSRKRIHAPSPFGRGAIAPVILEHHKFLVKSLEQRVAIAERYDRIRAGAGKRCHSTPELFYDALTVAPVGDGTLRSWSADEVRQIVLPREVMA